MRASAVKTHEIVIMPIPTLRHEITDPFGNPLIEIAIESAHNALEIVARNKRSRQRRRPRSNP